jgi:4-aminobutyrate aminotransferase-like enzyme/Ser/Thr protein kinase RdoA (MazF antagonist)
MTASGEPARLGALLTEKVPQSPVAAIEAVVRDRYGFAVRAERLQAEREEIFRLTSSDGRLFILKLTSALEDPDATDLITQALLHVARADATLPTPRLVLTTDDRSFCRAPWVGENAPTIQLFTYLSGQPLHSAPRSVVQASALGSMLARLDLALRTFRHPGENRAIDWDISRASKLVPLLDEVDGVAQRTLAASVLNRFTSHVEPRLSSLRHQSIHNDFNPHNLLVDEADADRIAGILDFGDMVRTALVHDVAIGASYLLALGSTPLEYPVAFVSAYHAVCPLLAEELDLLYDLMATRLAMTVAITEWRARRNPHNRAYITKNTALAWAGLEQLARLSREEAARQFHRACAMAGGHARERPPMVNAFDPTKAADMSPELQTLLARRARVLGPAYRLFYEKPVHVVRATGVRLYDETGAEYLDVYNNVPCVGHCHPRVVDAIARQAAIVNTHTRYLHETIVVYAERLLKTFPAPLTNVMFTCTGSEAVDLALRIARSCTQGTGIIVTEWAYHGVTAAAAEVSLSLGAGVPLGLHVRTVRAPTGADASEQFYADVQAAIDDLQRHGIKPAALLFDTIFSSDGILPHPAGFTAKAVAAIRAAGGIFIADEVQPGFARTGESMWGFQRHGLVPDLVVLGKPMGNGMPIAGVIARPELLEQFAACARYFNTFGGNPVACAAALAVLDVIEDEQLMAKAHCVGNYLQQGLRDLASRYARIGDVRGAGLFIGVELVTDRDTRAPDASTSLAIVNRLREKFVLISACGRAGNVLKIRPPLPFSLPDADQFLSRMADVLAEI